MIITVQNSQLKKVLGSFKSIVPANPMISAVENILFDVSAEGITLTVCNMEITMVSSIDCANKDCGQFLLPFSFINGISSLAGSVPLEISIEGENAVVRCSSDVFEVKSLAKASLFPTIPGFPEQKPLKIDQPFIDAIITAGETTIKGETSWPATKCVLLDISEDSITVASMTGPTMFTMSFDMESPVADKVLVSENCIKAISSIHLSEMIWNENHVAFIGENTKIISRIPVGVFPNYRTFLVDRTPTVTVNRKQLINGIKKVAISSPHLDELCVTLESNTIHLKGGNVDDTRSANITIPCLYSGQSILLKMNSKNFTSVLSQPSAEDIELSITDHTKPVYITSPEEKGYVALCATCV